MRKLVYYNLNVFKEGFTLLFQGTPFGVCNLFLSFFPFFFYFIFLIFDTAAKPSIPRKVIFFGGEASFSHYSCSMKKKYILLFCIIMRHVYAKISTIAKFERGARNLRRNVSNIQYLGLKMTEYFYFFEHSTSPFFSRISGSASDICIWNFSEKGKTINMKNSLSQKSMGYYLNIINNYK